MNMDDAPQACDSAIFGYGALLHAVQMSAVFADDKTFVDMTLNSDPEVVLQEFAALSAAGPPTRAALEELVGRHFSGPEAELLPWTPPDWSTSPDLLARVTDPELRKFAADLNQRWKILGRQMRPGLTADERRHSLVPVPRPFIIPGARFRELYYWDTYWIVGGLLAVGMANTARDMITNLLHLVNRFGFVPNGARLYFTRRSQPCLLTPMVGLYVRHSGDTQFVADHLPLLQREHDFWLQQRSVSVLSRSGQTHQMTRYCVTLGGPRPEGYSVDRRAIEGLSAAESVRVLSEKASACESGWDFSTRWLADVADPNSIKTSRIVPVDLNAFLALTERLLAEFCDTLGKTEDKERYERLATARCLAIDDVMWDAEVGTWFDFDLDTKSPRRAYYASNITPLFARATNVDLTSAAIASKIVNYLETNDVTSYPGGVPTSLHVSGEQWDLPNAWPPLVHMTVQGLSEIDVPKAKRMALTLAKSWISNNFETWKATNTMFEKYNAQERGVAGSGGEYSQVPVGFGWTNGVALMLLDKYANQLNSAL